jgi:hypothetical protein
VGVTAVAFLRRTVSWKRLDYLVHRWLGIVLGGMVLVWFVSGIAMAFYTWPALVESKRLALLTPFEPGAAPVGFARAQAAALEYVVRRKTSAGPPVAGRLMHWGGRLAYQFWGEKDGHYVSVALIDAQSAAVLSPITPDMAEVAARELVGPGYEVERIDRLRRGDHYMMERGYAHEYPAYRVRFNDPHATAVYVGVEGGTPFGVVTSLTRFTTWFGTVPHWLYFQWLLQDREGLWKLVNIVLPSVAVLLALTGIVLGCSQLFPRRRRGDWRPSPYRGISKYHHLAGIFFGLLVLAWTFSGVVQMVGGSNQARAGQAALTRGGPVEWQEIRLSEADALERLRARIGVAVKPIAIDLVQFRGRPGYDLYLADGREFWVDALSGVPRGELSQAEARDAARAVMGDTTRLESVGRLTAYDTYYYARAGREMHLPVWRITFADREHTALYLNSVNGTPVGFVDRSARRSRWLRDALHSFDYPVLNNRRLLWYAVVLPLLLAGSVSAFTGAWLLIRRVRSWA